jgi:RNA polymerase sigma factor (TIGR02999 family)
LPLVYDKLRKLAAHRLAQEQPGQTLQATALVHEAYLRLVDVAVPQQWNGRGHFFAAAAEAMRRILVENARHRQRIRHGGGRSRHELAPSQIADSGEAPDLLALDEALKRLEQEDGQAAQLVKLRYFTGLTIPQAAEILAVSPRKADFLWSFARAWLRRELADS